MSAAPFRLSPSEDNLFAGHQIDRSQPLKFKLNGREISGFVGDTVLSAVLASGITSVGTHRGFPLALDENTGLGVRLADAGLTPHAALPIERTPAIDGLELRTFSAAPVTGSFDWLKRLRGISTPSLGLNLDAELMIPGPFTQAAIAENIDAYIIIIGGGIAGLSAAAHAAKSGKSVLLIERRPYLGGDAVLFGQVAGEDTPGRIIERLTRVITKAPNVTVLKCADALSLTTDTVLVHQVHIEDGVPSAHLLKLTSKKIILATGTQDRLPVFPGNRLPGVTGLSTAFQRAWAYGVWVGAPSAVITNTNAAYRLALLAHDAGVTVDKLVDSRIAPQSRFAEFAKAYGVKSASGLKPQSIISDTDTQRLYLKMELSLEDGTGEFAPMAVGSVIASGGWQPRLALWQQAGGKFSLDGTLGRIHAIKGPSSIALAGSCMDFLSNLAVMQSGILAVDKLLRRKLRSINDDQISPEFESLDGDFPIARALSDENMAPAYFDNGSSLVAAAWRARRSIFKTGSAPKFLDPEAGIDRALSLGDLCTYAALGKFPAQAFETIARERAVVPVSFSKTHAGKLPDDTLKTPTKIGIPYYLKGRFGNKAGLWKISSSNERRFEVGNLLYTNSDTSDPMNALGVIIGMAPDDNRAAIAVIQGDAGEAGQKISIRNSHGHSFATMTEKVK